MPACVFGSERRDLESLGFGQLDVKLIFVVPNNNLIALRCERIPIQVHKSNDGELAGQRVK